jgi:hypothetical protein
MPERKLIEREGDGILAYGCSNCGWFHSYMALKQSSWHHPEKPIKAAFAEHVCEDPVQTAR